MLGRVLGFDVLGAEKLVLEGVWGCNVYACNAVPWHSCNVRLYKILSTANP